MKENKTTQTDNSVTAFINNIPDEVKRNDSFHLIEMIGKQTGLLPVMWGPSIIGFGSYHFKYESGRQGDMPLVCFSPRSSALVFYLSANFKNRAELLPFLGKFKVGKGCIYIKKLEDIDLLVLKKMIAYAIEHIQTTYPGG